MKKVKEILETGKQATNSEVHLQLRTLEVGSLVGLRDGERLGSAVGCKNNVKLEQVRRNKILQGEQMNPCRSVLPSSKADR